MTRAMPGAATDRSLRPIPAEGSALLAILMRLDEVLQEETAALRRQETAELAQFFQRKSQGLLELANIQRSLGNAPLGEPVRAALASVRGSLEVNRDLLKLHLDAASELIDVFSQAIRDSESDGTYDQSYGLRGRR